MRPSFTGLGDRKLKFETQYELEELILKEMDGLCNADEFNRLSDIISNNPAALRHYLEFNLLCSSMDRLGESGKTVDVFHDIDGSKVTELWRALAEEERTAESIYIEQPETPLPIPVFEHANNKQSQKQPLWPLVTAIAVAACMMIMIMYLAKVTPVPYRPVATITGCTGAVWQNNNNIGVNSRILNGTTLRLVEGYVEITFDSQARIVVQSPIEFRLEDENQIYFSSGKLSAVVPHAAKGFLVRTPGATIVDYGTEFGVIADNAGNTETDVFVGQVELRSGSDPVRFETSKRLTAGQACNVRNGVVSEQITKASPQSYTRSLPKKNILSAPGRLLDLADILGGGNGLGTGNKCTAIDPGTGEIQSEVTESDRIQVDNSYYTVDGNIYIDGVFVPLGGNYETVVSSAGHIFSECPETDSKYWIDITNKPITVMLGAENDKREERFASLKGITYGDEAHPAIMLHANSGITFDLEKIRMTNPGSTITRFTSFCGLSETLKDTGLWDESKSVLWVLLDGQVHSKVEIYSKAVTFADIDIEIDDSNHFLTLISTDGDNFNGGDWTLFGNPALSLSPVK